MYLSKNFFFTKNFIFFLLIALILFQIYKISWIDDDAMISFKSALNLVKGYGLTYNISERVQSFSNPLWTLIISIAYFFTNEFFYTAMVLNLFLTFVLIILIIKFSNNDNLIILGLFAFLFSKAFVEFSSSGLENSLGHLLTAMAIISYTKIKVNDSLSFLKFTFLVSLIFVHRIDGVLILIPLIISSLLIVRPIKDTLIFGFIGSIPAVLWVFFSFLYYGFIFPNTYYAKLGAWLTSDYYYSNGINYFLDSLWRDFFTLPFILTSIIIGLFSKKKTEILIALGILLYLIYIIKIGGDFMSGRLLTIPLVTSVVLLSLNKNKFLNSKSFSVSSISILLLFSIFFNQFPFKMKSTHVNIYGPDDILEAAHKSSFSWHSKNNLFGLITKFLNTSYEMKIEKKTYIIRGAGYAGLCSNVNTHLIDIFGLADPLLARLPTLNPKLYGRPQIGHLKRAIPTGYPKTLITGELNFTDKDLEYYYYQLRHIITGRIFNPGRLLTAIRLNKGGWKDYINKDQYRSPENFNSSFVIMWKNPNNENQKARVEPYQSFYDHCLEILN